MSLSKQVHFWFRSLSVVCLMCVLACAKQGAPEYASYDLETPPRGQLPVGATPTHYTLELKIVPEEDRFSGRAEIKVDLETSTKIIWLHGKNLKVSRARVLSGDRIIKAQWRILTEDGVAALQLSKRVRGSVVIQIDYDAPFDTHLKGLYKARAGRHDYAFTQFEAIRARLAFPCFDEPRFKTPFDVSLIVKRNHVAAANTPELKRTSLSEGMTRIDFETSKAMPTYLVAWAVGPLDVVEAPPIPANEVRKRAIPFRGLAAKGQGKKLRYALQHTPAMLENLERYFDIEYPYAKLDIVAVPDFASGAMENVGLITFREWLLLIDPSSATEEQKRWFAYVMAHELAHQWFGNLVTMPWWNDIWLNESFATWMGNKVITNLYPEYRAEVSRVYGTQNAMRVDSLTNAQEIRRPVKDNHDINNAFSSITYEKGGAMLGMFEEWLSFKTFREGLRQYMRTHSWKTARAEDLLSALDEVSGLDVSTAFQSFLDQPGVPVISTHVECEQNQVKLFVEQERYFPMGSKGDPEQVWNLPICVQTSEETMCDLIASDSAQKELSHCPTWYMPNKNAAGYYRFRLEPNEWRELRDEGFAVLPSTARLAVVDSVFAQFDRGDLGVRDVFRWFRTWARDKNRHIAVAPMRVLRFALEHVKEPRARKRIDAFARQLYMPIYKRLGWKSRPGEEGETRILREAVISFLALHVRDERIRREAARRGFAYLGFRKNGRVNERAVDRQLIQVSLQVAAQRGGSSFFKHLVKTLRKSQDATLRRRVLSALGSVETPHLAEKARKLALDNVVRVNEVRDLLRPQLRNAATRVAAWGWLQSNFEALGEKSGSRSLSYAPWYVTRFCSEKAAAEIEAFFGSRIEGLAGGPRNLAGALESIRLCTAKVDVQVPNIQTYFRK